MPFGATRIAVIGAALTAGLALFMAGPAAAADFRPDPGSEKPLASGSTIKPGTFSMRLDLRRCIIVRASHLSE